MTDQHDDRESLAPLDQMSKDIKHGFETVLDRLAGLAARVAELEICMAQMSASAADTTRRLERIERKVFLYGR
jgi:hypothetical protein